MRLFIAIPLPKDVQKSVWAFEEALRENASSVILCPEEIIISPCALSGKAANWQNWRMPCTRPFGMPAPSR